VLLVVAIVTGVLDVDVALGAVELVAPPVVVDEAWPPPLHAATTQPVAIAIVNMRAATTES
jgi:hypothetical protein